MDEGEKAGVRGLRGRRNVWERLWWRELARRWRHCSHPYPVAKRPLETERRQQNHHRMINHLRLEVRK
jgi:hypothetical protein